MSDTSFDHSHKKRKEAWFVYPSGREYFGAESTAFLSAIKFTKNLSAGKMNC